MVAVRGGDRRAALKFLKRTMKRYGRPRLIVTDRLRSYGVPQRKGRIHDCKLYRRFKSIFPLHHRGRPYMTKPARDMIAELEWLKPKGPENPR